MEDQTASKLYKQGQFHEALERYTRDLKATNDSGLKESCLFNQASCYASLGEFNEALELFSQIKIEKADLHYNRALCNFKAGNLDEALRLIDILITKSKETYPELFIKNPLTRDSSKYQKQLEDSCIKEAVNLKSAIIYRQESDSLESKRCFDEICDRSLIDQDLISKHNLALYGSSTDASSSLDSLNELINETNESDQAIADLVHRNIIIISLRLGLNDIAKQFWNYHKDRIQSHFSTETVQFIHVMLDKNSLTSEVFYRRLDNCLDQSVKALQLSKEGSEEKKALYDIILSILMEQGSLLWSENQYVILERLLMKFEEYLKDTITWRKNLAHTLYMTDNNYEECASLYESLLPDTQGESLLCVDPIVLANLSVSYVLTGQNSQAESLIEDVQRDEKEYISLNSPDASFTLTTKSGSLETLDNDDLMNTFLKKPTENCPAHLTIINIVIGTLYCAKNNFDFGLVRLFKALEPMESKLNLYTWYHAKRCILGSLDRHCKHIVFLKDDLFEKILQFLIKCEKAGILIEARFHDTISGGDLANSSLCNSVTYEARYLRSLVLSIVHD